MHYLDDKLTFITGSTWDAFKKAEKGFLKGNKIDRLSLNQLKQLCEVYSIGTDELRKKKTRKPIVEALEIIVCCIHYSFVTLTVYAEELSAKTRRLQS